MEYSGLKSFLIIDGMSMNIATPERLLVARCKAGDHDAFTELIRRSSPIALRTIRSIARNPADIEDVMQDTVVNALKGLRSFKHESKFSTWLTRIAVNNALLLLRRRRNKIEISLDTNSDASGTSPLHLADRRIDPEQALIREQSIELVRTAVQALPPSLREYVEQLCLRDRSHKEVARALGISLEAGKSRSLRARLKLRCLLASRRGRTRVKLHLEEVRQPGERTV